MRKKDTKEPISEDVTKATSKPKTGTVGFVGMKTSSGKIEEEFLRDLQWPTAGKVYKEMSSNDAVVGGCLYLIETLIRRAKWRVEPGKDGNQELADFVQSCMDDMEQTWEEFMSSALSMLTYGFSFHAVSYKVRRGPLEKDLKFRSQYSDGKIGWRDFAPRSQASLYEWTIDQSTGKVLEFVQDLGGTAIVGSANVKIPLEGNLLFRTRNINDSPEGWSLLRRAYRSWYFKRYIEELEGIGIERSLAGIPLLQPPEDVPIFDKNIPEMVEMLNWAQTLVNSLRQDRNHGLVLPFGWDFKLLGPESKSAALNTDTIIHRHESRIALSMLADIVIMGGDRTGSFALGEVKQNMLTQSLQTIINGIASVINRNAVAQLLAFNGIQTETPPKIVADAVDVPDAKELALLLRAINIDVTKSPELFNFLMRITGAPTIEDAALIESMSNAANEADSSLDMPQDGLTNDFKQSEMSYT